MLSDELNILISWMYLPTDFNEQEFKLNGGIFKLTKFSFILCPI